MQLTEKDILILRCIALGYQNKHIANVFEVQTDTIKNHLTRIYKILKVKNRTQAVVKAIKEHRLLYEQ